MRRYWIEQSEKSSDRVSLRGDNFHHIIEVCRQGVGSKFEVLTEEGKAYLVEVEQVGRKDATARVLEERIIEPLAKPHLHLALSISRYHVMDAVIEKAVEMGVKSVHPFFSEYSFVRNAKTLGAGKFERWNKIVKSATQQCGRGELMEIHNPSDLDPVLARIAGQQQSLGLFAYEGGGDSNIKSYLQRQRQSRSEPVQDLWLVIGSEGGFSAAEVAKLRERNLSPVTLGSQVLRVETACIALVSALKYEFDLMV